MKLFSNPSPLKKRNKFPIVNTNFLTTQFGMITPFIVREVVPGDTISGYSSVYTRFMPLATPQLSRCRAYCHYYFVPSRILSGYEDYEQFITDNKHYRSQTTISFILSSLNAQYGNKFSYTERSLDRTLYDYMGINLAPGTHNNSNVPISLEPFVAFWKMWLDHYCNTRTKIYLPYAWDNTNQVYEYGYCTYDYMLERFKEFKSYVYDQTISDGDFHIQVTDSQNQTQPICLLSFFGIGLYHHCFTRDYFTSAYPQSLNSAGNVPIGTTIDEFRSNLAQKEYLERWARSGDTVGDWLWQFFHVVSPDKSLNRSEFLGGGRFNMNISEVLQTSESTEDSPLGDVGGVSRGKSRIGFGKRNFTEYGWFIGVIFFVPQQSYFQGIPKMYDKFYCNDLYNEVWDGIGDEPIKNREIYNSGGDVQNQQTFGLQPRYLDYKIAVNEIHGDFKDTLIQWHAARKFNAMPTIDTVQYVNPNPLGVNRIFTYTGTDDPTDYSKILCRIRNEFVFKRKMRYFGYPKL